MILKLFKRFFILLLPLNFFSCGIEVDIPDINFDFNFPCNISIDEDEDGITDDTEKDPININLYGCNYLVYNFNVSIAYGQPNNGALTFGYNLNDNGFNIYHYNGNHQVNTDDWGTAKLIFVLAYAARNLYCSGDDSYFEITSSSFQGPIQIGDMSLQNGGYFHPHTSHQNGLDVEGRYIRKDRNKTSLNIVTNSEDYDEAATHNLFLAFHYNYVGYIENIYVDKDALGFDILYNGQSIFTDVEGYSDRYHVRITCPDGQCQ